MSHIVRRIVLSALTTLLAVPAAIPADTAYLGPVTVRLLETKDDGKTAPIKHEPVWINARHADTDAEGNAIFDGIPAGQHNLQIHLPGYAAIDRQISLATGTRAPIEVNVPRTPPVTWEGSLVDSASGLPVVGAAVTIRPVDVPAALRGGGTEIGRAHV
jgi:hypothetical protein